MTAPAHLRIVQPPKDALRRLFAEEADLRRQLADNLAAQNVERKRYAAAEGLCVLPSLATIKQVLARKEG